MRYLKDHVQRQQQQSLLMSSHRIDESLSLCDRVLMLVDGQTFLDGDINAFNDLAYQYYQVDVVLNAAYNIHTGGGGLSGLSTSDCYVPLSISLVDYFVLQLESVCKAANIRDENSSSSSKCIERVVAYSETLVRVTFEKRLVPMSLIWHRLAQWRVEYDLVTRFSFRNMDMEEVLATVISTATIAAATATASSGGAEME
jgi:hypothetical protein